MAYLNILLAKLREFEIVIKGCTEQEISNLQQLAGGNLPACYIEFLSIMGKDMDRKEPGMRGYLVGNAVFYDDLWDNKEEAKKMMDEDGSALQLSNDDFVFYDHQGYTFAFFKLSEGDNPPVYFYKEGSGQAEFIKTADTLSSFYERYLEGDKNLFKV